MDDMKKVDAHFREAFDGLGLSGSYLDRVKLRKPDEFDMHVKLKLPLKVTPVKDTQRPGFVLLRAEGGKSHPAVVNGYVNRKSLQDWLRQAFNKIFEMYTNPAVSESHYIVRYEQKGYGCAHTIVAKHSKTPMCISFDFVPAFEFNYNQWPLPSPSSVSLNVRQQWNWFAVPQQKRPADDRTFMVCAPHWEREMMKGKTNLKNILRLMKAFRDRSIHDLPKLSSYMLKTVILLQLEKHSDEYWQQDLTTLLIDMWRNLLTHFRQNNLPFFLAKDCNHFDRLNRDNFHQCHQTVEIILHRLNNFASHPKPNMLNNYFFDTN